MLVIASSSGTPESSTPTTIPKLSSTSCITPATSRLEPLMTSPAERSSVAVVSRLPGRNVTSAGISTRIEASVVFSGATANASQLTRIAAHTGIRICAVAMYPA